MYTDGVWVGSDDKACLPKYLFPYYAKLTHGMNIVSKGSMLDDLKNSSFPTVSSQTHPAYANLTRHKNTDYS